MMPACESSLQDTAAWLQAIVDVPLSRFTEYVCCSGMSCRKSKDHCLSTTGGFDFVLCSGIITSLIAATLCFVTFEFNDLRLKHDITHLYSIVSFFIYRLLELCARVTVIALFAVSHPSVCTI